MKWHIRIRHTDKTYCGINAKLRLGSSARNRILTEGSVERVLEGTRRTRHNDCRKCFAAIHKAHRLSESVAPF